MSVANVQNGNLYICQRDGTLANISAEFLRKIVKVEPPADAAKGPDGKVEHGSLITVQEGSLCLIDLSAIGTTAEEVLAEYEKMQKGAVQPSEDVADGSLS